MSVVDNVLQADLELLQESQSISNTSGRYFIILPHYAMAIESTYTIVLIK